MNDKGKPNKWRGDSRLNDFIGRLPLDWSAQLLDDLISVQASIRFGDHIESVGYGLKPSIVIELGSEGAFKMICEAMLAHAAANVASMLIAGYVASEYDPSMWDHDPTYQTVARGYMRHEMRTG